MIITEFVFLFLTSNKDVVDGNMDQLDEETDTTHNEEPDQRRVRDRLEFFPIRFCAFLHQMDRIFRELFQWLDEHFFESFLSFHVYILIG
jgi:hypothetical protein